MSVAVQHAREVRDRLRNPPNAVKDIGIDLKRQKLFQIVPIVPAAEPVMMATVVMEPIRSDAIEQLMREEAPRVTVVAVQIVICDLYKTTLNDMKSPRRDRASTHPRMIAMYLAKKLTRQSLPQIGRRFGGRDHTTVMHAVKKITLMRLADSNFDTELSALEAVFA